ncbi:MAG TPA: YceI family protein [Candidatus Polarisedimenticolia bacterium]|nr:YceI family protein [Candidatus Polarisedimenticolia bacterium]
MKTRLPYLALIVLPLAGLTIGRSAALEAGDGTRYRINAARSRLTAQVAVGGVFKGLGHPHVIAIQKFRGEVQANPRITGSGSIRLTIATGSLAEVGKQIKAKDRPKVNRAVHKEALETARFPEAVFKSTQVTVKQAGRQQYNASIRGDLSLHGVTHTVSFPAKVRLQGSRLRAQGGFTLLHSDYGIKRLSAGGGTVKAKSEITVSFDIVADKQ